MSLVSLLVLISFPWVADFFDLERRTTNLAVTGLILAFGGGALARIFRGAFARGRVADEVEEAIALLKEHYPGGSVQTQSDAAVRILVGAYVSNGPTTVNTFERDEVTARLGPALEYVLAVERFLRERKEIYPVFSLI